MQNWYYLPMAAFQQAGVDLPASVERHCWELIHVKVGKSIYMPLVRCRKCKGKMERGGDHLTACSGQAGK